MECRGTFTAELIIRFYPALPFVPTKIINIIMILSPQEKRLGPLMPHHIHPMVLNIRLTVFLFSTPRLIFTWRNQKFSMTALSYMHWVCPVFHCRISPQGKVLPQFCPKPFRLVLPPSLPFSAKVFLNVLTVSRGVETFKPI